MSAEILPVIYRDDWLVAVHKPAGLLVHRSEIDRHETRFALQIVRDQLGQKVWSSHRLDKPTSGLLLLGLTPEAGRALSMAFEAQAVDKQYLAVVRGWPDAAGTIDHPLARIVDAYAPGASREAEPQPAVTGFSTLATTELQWAVDRYPTSRYALVELTPHTGRRHQLRRHLKHVSHPIIGDTSYGKSRHNRAFADAFGVSRLLLACTGMSFTHPVTGERLALDCPLADDFARVVSALGWDAALPAPLVRPSAA